MAPKSKEQPNALQLPQDPWPLHDVIDDGCWGAWRGHAAAAGTPADIMRMVRQLAGSAADRRSYSIRWHLEQWVELAISARRSGYTHADAALQGMAAIQARLRLLLDAEVSKSAAPYLHLCFCACMMHKTETAVFLIAHMQVLQGRAMDSAHELLCAHYWDVAQQAMPQGQWQAALTVAHADLQAFVKVCSEQHSAWAAPCVCCACA
jgi:hypothetical protein